MSQAPGVNNPKYTVPKPRSAVLRRQRLIDLLHQNVDRPLQLVCAPAGYGKTTLLADFVQDTDVTVCWYTVDELDRDPASFLYHVAEAVRSRFPHVPPLEWPSEDRDDYQGAVYALCDIIRSGVKEFFLLVVDDFHLTGGSREVVGALDLLVRNLPENCRLILSSRELPQLPSLPRLISQSAVAGLGASELRFTAEEIRLLLKQNFDIEMGLEEARRLEAQSEGWITSILLTTQSLWKGILRDVVGGKNPTGVLFEYMAAEVFLQQSPRVQRFLMYTSICGEFDARLAQVLTGDEEAAQLLQELEARNLFIYPLEGPQGWYRYHHLFRDFLRERLAKEDGAEVRELHTRAGDHYASIGEWGQAINHYLQAEAYGKAAALLEDRVDEMSHQGLWQALGRWLEALPAEETAGRPRLLLYLGKVYQRQGRNDEAIGVLNSAIEVAREQGELLLEAQALMARSVSLRYKGATQMAIRDCRSALALAQQAGSPLDEADARAHLGTAYALQGKFARAEREFKASLRGYQDRGEPFRLAEIHKRLGSIYSELGDYDRSVMHFDEAQLGWRRLGNQGQLSVTLNNMAYLYYQRGEYAEAEPLAREAASLARATDSPRNEAYALMTLSEVQRESSHYQEAMESCRRSMELARQCSEAPLVCYGTVAMGETYRLLGEADKARSLLREAIAMASERRQNLELGLSLTSLGIIEYSSGNYRESHTLLVKACQLLARSGQRRALARAHLHLAQCHFLQKEYAEALDELQKVADICSGLGYSRFLVAEGRDLPLLFQYAATRGQRSEFFTRIVDEVNREAYAASARGSRRRREPPRKAPQRPPLVEVHSLGGFRVVVDGSPVLNTAWGSLKAREMFLFLLYRGQALHREKIVEALWPDSPLSKANSNFHSTLYRLRSAIHPDCVQREGELYRLNPRWNFFFDVHEFERLSREAEEETDLGRKERLLTAAVELYKGPFAEEMDSEWCNLLRTELELRWTRAVFSLASLYEEKGERRRSADLLEKVLEVDELQEEVYYKLMDLYLELDDSSSALRVYHRCVSVFGEASSPSPRLSRLLARFN